MFVINTRESTAIVSKVPKPEHPGEGIHYIETKLDVQALETRLVIDVFNAVARAHPDMKTAEVQRFSTRSKAEDRLWGFLLGLKANEATDEPKTEKKVNGEKKTRKSGGVRRLADKEVKKAAKTYPLREGSMQQHAFDLISQSGGISVDDFVKEMNAKKKAKYTRGNAWSSLVYILHTNKGYGIRCKEDRFYLVK